LRPPRWGTPCAAVPSLTQRFGLLHLY
jgi:hypothetical protein